MVQGHTVELHKMFIHSCLQYWHIHAFLAATNILKSFYMHIPAILLSPEMYASCA